MHFVSFCVPYLLSVKLFVAQQAHRIIQEKLFIILLFIELTHLNSLELFYYSWNNRIIQEKKNHFFLEWSKRIDVAKGYLPLWACPYFQMENLTLFRVFSVLILRIIHMSVFSNPISKVSENMWLLPIIRYSNYRGWNM